MILTQVNTHEVLTTLRNVNISNLVAGAVLFQLATVIRAIRWQILLQDAAVKIDPITAIGLTHIGEFVATALPISYAGDAIRILELEVKHSRAEISGIGVLDRLIGMAVLMIVSLMSLALGYHLMPLSIALPLGLLAATALITLIIILNPTVHRLLFRLIPSRLARTAESRSAFFYQGIMRRSPQALLIAMILSITNVIVTILVHYVVSVGVLTKTLTLGHFFVFVPIVNLSLFFPTVGGLGIREVGYALILAPFGISAEEAIGLGLGIYLTRLWVSLIGGGLWVRNSLRK